MTGKELREWRDERGLSQADVARICSVERRSVGRWEAKQECDIPEGDVTALMSHWTDEAVRDVTCDKPDVTNVTSPVDVTSECDMVPTDVYWQLAELVKGMGGQMSEMKEAVDLLRHRVKGAEDEIKELKARPMTMTGALIQDSIRTGSMAFPKPHPGQKGWRSYDKPGGGGD